MFLIDYYYYLTINREKKKKKNSFRLFRLLGETKNITKKSLYLWPIITTVQFSRLEQVESKTTWKI